MMIILYRINRQKTFKLILVIAHAIAIDLHNIIMDAVYADLISKPFYN